MIFRRLFFIASLLFIALGSQLLLLQSKELKEISLEEVLSIGSLDDDFLFQWVGVAVDSLGYIYVTDSMDYTLKKFDARGNLIKKTGRKGQGPGEFMAPRLLDCSEKFVYVTDQYIPGIQIFDKDLNFKRRLPLTLPVADFRVLSDGRIAVAALILEEAHKIFIFDSAGEVKSELKYSERGSALMMDVVNFDLDSQGNFYLAYLFQDRVERFDRKGKKLWSHNLLEAKKVKKKKISSYEIPTEVVYKDITLDSSGNLFVLGGHFSKNRSRDVYVLDSQGRHLTTFTLPDSSHCLYIDGQQFLYSRANAGVTLKKYRMRYVYK